MIWVFGLAGFIVSFFILLVMNFLSSFQEKRRVRKTAKDILQSGREKESFIREQAQSEIQEYKNKLNKEDQSTLRNLSEKNRLLQASIDKKKYKNQNHIYFIKNKVQKIKNQVSSMRKKIVHKDQNLEKKLEPLKNKYLEGLKKIIGPRWKEVQKEIEEKEIQKGYERGRKAAQNLSDIFQRDLEKNTMSILECVLNRFQRPYCPERGVKGLFFKNLKSLQKFLGEKNSHISAIEKQCGVDIIVDENKLSLFVQGLDPVRREWGRLSLKKLERKNRITSGIISSVIQRSKKDLFHKISRDGRRICQALKLKNPPLEVQNMMGALRYRYSFAQNQHFHCEEVAYLCGLLRAEFQENISQGRRAGLFHDIGKAMDHAQSGGHAVIGADFIQKHGEDKEVVHAIRAHHHDVSPKSSLDFFVIAADALSGARPGARKATVDSYDQKVLSLEKIGKSFKGVKDLYIMNAGREMRVIVDPKQIDDLEALKLSKKIAQKIEEECSYPGWIKVTVVRKVEVNKLTHQKTA